MCNQWCLEFGRLSFSSLQKPSRILEVGSRNVNGSMRDILTEYASDYIGVDLFDGPGVDVVCNVASLTDTFAHQSFDLVVSTEMLEHCLGWQDALYQMASVLRQDGLLLITTRSPGFELHDYPSDHWRFSYRDFEQIFKPLGEIIVIQDDMTLGWACGIGILVKRKLEQSQLSEWKLWLDTFDVYSMADEAAYSNPILNSNPEKMIFDQYSRYKACSDLLHQTGFVAGNTVLDVGSGPECQFGQFMPDATMAYVDPLIPSGTGAGRITGDVFSNELDGQLFDCVSAVDVLEHVPPEYRQAFIARLASLGKNIVILGFPSSESTDALDTDNVIHDNYRAIFGMEYPWLKEHAQYGLPSLTETVKQLSQLGWHCQTIAHGHAPWLRELLSFVICIWEIPSLSDIVLGMSEKFNRELYPHDFRSPSYRQFVVASRNLLPSINTPIKNTSIELADDVFRVLIEDAQRKCFTMSLRQLAARDSQMSSLNQKIEDVSCWGTSEHEKNISLEQVLSDKHVELMKMFDWAQGMKTELDWHNGAEGVEHAAKVAEYDIKVAEFDAKVAEHHEKVIAFNNRLAECSIKGRSEYDKNALLERALSDKQAELMAMSGWAQGMMFELNRRNSSIFYRIETTAKRAGKLVRKKLVQSFVGNMVRHRRRFCKKQVSLEAIKQSVLDNHGRLIIVFPIIAWNFRWQRPQHMVSLLRDNGFSVLYVAMTLSPLERRLRSNNDAISCLNFNELAPHVNKVWLNSNAKLNVYTDLIEGDDLFNISIGLDSLISELHPKSIIYLVQFPNWGPVAQDLRKKLGGKIVFDCMDDHSGFSTNSAHVSQIEKILIEKSDLVLASSNILEEKARVINSNTIQIKNGTEFKHFAIPIHNGQLDHLRNRPIIGYYGAISDWFDMQLMAYCALQRPDWNFVLIGSTFGADLQPIEGLRNVHLLGEKSYQELPGYLAYFDLCTIPFKIVPLTLATNPVKFYEYLSAGKPVVSVDLPELGAYHEDCYLAGNADEFVAQLDRAFSERNDTQKIERRLKIARENSWDARVSAIMESEIFRID